MIEIRRATAGDETGVSIVHVSAWQAGYRGLMPDAYLDGLRAEDRAKRYTFDKPDGPRTYVAIDDGELRGFATIVDNELAALNVAPRSWGRGIGSALLAHIHEIFVAERRQQAFLWVLVGNDRATKLYVRDGWTDSGDRKTESVWGIDCEQQRFTRQYDARCE